MPLIPVSSIDDPQVAHYRDLSRQNLTRQSGRFIAEGEKVVERLIASRFAVDSLLVEPAFALRYQPQVAAEVPIYVVSRETMQATIGFKFHRGVLACGRRQPIVTVNQIPASLSNALQTILVCPDVQDPTNLGSIIRTSAAFGCTAVLLGRECADPFSRRVLRVSMGAALHLPIVESRDLAADVALLAANQFEIVAATLDKDTTPLDTFRRGQRLALLLGSEGHGLSAEWLARSQRRVTIPMHLGVDSLNVAIAAAVLLYQLSR